MTPEHLAKIIAANKNRIITKETREKLSKAHKGVKQSQKAIYNMVVGHITNKYQVFYNNELIFETFIKSEIYKFFKKTYNVSRTIIDKIINNTYYSKFNKYMFLNNINIIVSDITKEEKEMLYNKGVSTTPDECKEVG